MRAGPLTLSRRKERGDRTRRYTSKGDRQGMGILTGIFRAPAEPGNFFVFGVEIINKLNTGGNQDNKYHKR
jgi:hypothetical protein